MNTGKVQSRADIMNVPLCINCIHHSRQPVPGMEMHRDICSALLGQPSPVDGQPIVPSDCGLMRISSICGVEGKLFVGSRN